MVLGCAPPSILAIQEYFHPEDLMAIGLAFAGLACARRGQWIWAGILLGLAITSQQFALLVAAPLLMVAPRSERIRYATAVVGSAAVVIVGMLVVTSGRVIDVLTGTTATPPSGGTFLYLADLHGFSLLFVSRVLPIVLAMALAWWSARRLGAAALDPVPLISLIATSLCLRLVFEVNIFGYYFMAVAASLIVLNVIRGRIISMPDGVARPGYVRLRSASLGISSMDVYDPDGDLSAPSCTSCVGARCCSSHLLRAGSQPISRRLACLDRSESRSILTSKRL